MKPIHAILLIAILILAATFRLVGRNWDHNAHLHPDERFLTMVASGISWPKTVTEFFDSDTSPANPHNKGFSFYVYGTYPLHVTKIVSQIVGMHTYDGFAIVGRTISAVVDLFTTTLVFLIAFYLTKKPVVGLLSALCYAVAVLPIQLSHFFTVDPFVTLWSTAALYRLIRKKYDGLLGIFVALAVGAKISAALIVGLVAISFLIHFPWRETSGIQWQKRYNLLLNGIICVVFFGITIFLVYPYLLDDWALNQKIIENWKQLASFEGPTTTFPPGIQWIGVPAWQPVLDLFVWGLGIPMGILATVGFLAVTIRIITTKKISSSGILVLWIIMLLGYNAMQFAKAMRYMWPIYPAIAVVSGIGLFTLMRYTQKFSHVVYPLIVFLLVLWPLAFATIYTRDNTRVSAVRWIYETIPKGSVIAWEHWDDPLPFPLEGQSPSRYIQKAIPMFTPDEPKKWEEIAHILADSDFLILASNRAYGAIGRTPNRFPHSYFYYEQLVGGELGYTPINIFMSRPYLPLPGISLCMTVPGFSYGHLLQSLHNCSAPGVTIIDDYADESFTVYDHPIVTVFENTHRLSASTLQATITHHHKTMEDEAR